MVAINCPKSYKHGKNWGISVTAASDHGGTENPVSVFL